MPTEFSLFESAIPLATMTTMIAHTFRALPHVLVGLICSLHLARSIPVMAQRAEPSLIITHANVHTMDASQPLAEAIAIRGHRIVAVGKSQSINKLAGSETRVIDAAGRLVLPGFNDAHVHFTSGGRQLSNVELRDASSPAEFAARIAAHALSLPAGRWITGGDWDHENWATGQLPTKHDIDHATSLHPVFVTRLDGHMGLANSRALALGKVTRETDDPPGGYIVRDAQGEPTGVLKDAAMALVARHIPELTFEERIAAARAATEHAARLGITSVQDMSGSRDVSAYFELMRRGELKTRIYVAAPLPNWAQLAATGLTAASGNPWIRQGALKGFADGSLGSTTALFFDPYLDAPDTRGLPSDEMVDPVEMESRVRQADAARLQVMVHAIGDRANDQMLSIYERVISDGRPRDRRLRIEHAQHLRPDTIKRFAKHDVIASMQPYHCADDGRWAEKRIGAERATGTYAFRSLLDAGVRLAFGSDWNVAPLDPLQGIAAAVTRQTLDGKHPDGWIPQERITVEEAVRAYTVGSAYAEFQEEQKGTLSVGKLADIVILSADIFSIPPSEISEASVTTTIVDGKVIYCDLPK